MGDVVAMLQKLQLDFHYYKEFPNQVFIPQCDVFFEVTPLGQDNVLWQVHGPTKIRMNPYNLRQLYDYINQNHGR